LAVGPAGILPADGSSMVWSCLVRIGGTTIYVMDSDRARQK